MKLINSSFYEDLADWVILYQEDLVKLIRSFDLFKKDGIIYCKTDFTPLLFEHIRISPRKYKLITHHSDYSIDERRFLSKPPCIKKWFAINPTYRHPDLIAIPLGTKTPEGRSYHEQQYKIKWFEAMQETLFLEKKNTEKVYCNWTITNNARQKILADLKVPYHQASGKGFTEFIEEMSKYKFVISPPGNGIDCHRTWEALYVGAYPIVINNYIYNDWESLPIIQVSSFKEISEDLLTYHLNKNYDYTKLSTKYWIKKIKE